MAVFSLGFRPFFFAGAFHACFVMVLWSLWLFDFAPIPSDLDPVFWHGHELLFGVTEAFIAGFLLTAVPNWTNRPPLVGNSLIALLSLWLMARCIIFISGLIPFEILAVILLVFPIALTIWVGQQIISSRNRRNSPILILLILYSIAHGVYLYEIYAYEVVYYGQRFALACVMMLIILIGGRVTPNFTGNWLRKHVPGKELTGFNGFDTFCVAVSIVGLLAWVLLPMLDMAKEIGILMMVCGGCHILRQSRWRPLYTIKEPLVTVLHVAYAFVPVGFILIGLSCLLDDHSLETGGLHAWTVGAVGLMTLAIMTRASRGHSGRELSAPSSTVLIYAFMVVAALSRMGAAYWPDYSMALFALAGLDRGVFRLSAFLLADAFVAETLRAG